MTAPVRSEDQRRDALRRANRIRVHRAELKRDVKAGRVLAVDVVGLRGTDVDPRVATMKVYDLLLAVPKVGRVKANVAMHNAGISPSKTVGGLTERQRRDFALALNLPTTSRYRRLSA